MAGLSSEEKYRRGIISREQRELDMLREEYKKKKDKIDPFYINSTLPEAQELSRIGRRIEELKEIIREQNNKEYESSQEGEYSDDLNATILSAKKLYNKELYDKNVDSYMNKKNNFWQKAKNLFAGKKQKNTSNLENIDSSINNKELTDVEIIEKYGKQVVDEMLFTEIKQLKKELEHGTINEFQYRKEEQELVKKYRDLLNEAREYAQEFGIDHFAGKKL